MQKLDRISERLRPLDDMLSPVRLAVAPPEVDAHRGANDEDEELRSTSQLASTTRTIIHSRGKKKEEKKGQRTYVIAA